MSTKPASIGIYCERYGNNRVSFQQTIRSKIGTELYSKLEAEAEKEVAIAMKIPPLDEYGKENYYRQRNVLGFFLCESEKFEEVGLKINPLDVINLLFRCKVLFAVGNEAEYRKRVGGGSYPNEHDFICKWLEHEEDINLVIDRYFDRLESKLEDKILISQISCFHSYRDEPQAQQAFFDELFVQLNLPFECFLDEPILIRKHREMEPGLLRGYNSRDAKDFLGAPSIGFRTHGSELYCRLHASAYLRSLFNLLRIASFILAPQRDRGWRDVQFMAPTNPFLRGQPPFTVMEVPGCFCWEEDEKESWAKVPDGCLFLSFGYRGLSKMWLDGRCFTALKEFILENRIIFDELKNPWTTKVLNDLIPTIDILSSAAQNPDVGVKILLLYCCLEHLFVPKDVKTDNKKYIVGGLHALNPALKPWFNKLYELRCSYAHRGFVLKDDATMRTIVDSMKNITSLLVSKLGAT